jgi:hypothetical protein
MSVKDLIFGERSVTKVVGVFDNRETAQAAAQRVTSDAKLDPPQVQAFKYLLL